MQATAEFASNLMLINVSNLDIIWFIFKTPELFSYPSYFKIFVSAFWVVVYYTFLQE